MLFLAIHRNVVRSCAVDGVECVDSREAAIVTRGVITAILVIHADQHTMVNRSGIKVAVDLIIQGDGIHFLVRAGITPV